MAANKRTDKQIQDDRVYIAQQLVKGLTVREICVMLNEENVKKDKTYSIVHSMVHYDIKAILSEWRDERKDMIDLVIDRELRKLDVIEYECWKAWEKSKGGKRITRISGGATSGESIGGGTIKERTIEETFGDPRFFEKILTCMDRRKELLGYAAPKKVEFSGSVGVGITPMDEESIEREKARIYGNILKIS